MWGWPGVPRRLRTPLLLAALLAAHLLLGPLLETTRTVAASRAAAPLAGTPLDGGGPLPDPGATVRRRLAAARRAVEAPPQGVPAARLPVLDLDPRRGRLVLGGGREHGVRPGALAFVDAGCVGTVDRVEPHLARVRLLQARGSALPVRVDRVRPGLPGGLEELYGILEGNGSRAFLGRAFLAEALRPGDLMVTLAREGQRELPVGVVETGGVRPPVRPLADPVGLSNVAVEGVAEPVHPEDLYEDVPFGLLVRGGGGGRLPVGMVRGPVRLPPGTALHRGGWYVGSVTAAGPDCATVSGAGDPGRTLTVRVVGDTGAHRCVIRGDGAGGVRVVSWPGGAPRKAGEVVVVTAGGQQLVPPWLLVGEGRWDPHAGGLDLELPATWPRSLLAARFRHEEARRRLLGSGR